MPADAAACRGSTRPHARRGGGGGGEGGSRAAEIRKGGGGEGGEGACKEESGRWGGEDVPLPRWDPRRGHQPPPPQPPPGHKNKKRARRQAGERTGGWRGTAASAMSAGCIRHPPSEGWQQGSAGDTGDDGGEENAGACRRLPHVSRMRELVTVPVGGGTGPRTSSPGAPSPTAAAGNGRLRGAGAGPSIPAVTTADAVSYLSRVIPLYSPPPPLPFPTLGSPPPTSLPRAWPTCTVKREPAALVRQCFPPSSSRRRRPPLLQQEGSVSQVQAGVQTPQRDVLHQSRRQPTMAQRKMLQPPPREWAPPQGHMEAVQQPQPQRMTAPAWRGDAQAVPPQPQREAARRPHWVEAQEWR